MTVISGHDGLLRDLIVTLLSVSDTGSRVSFELMDHLEASTLIGFNYRIATSPMELLKLKSSETKIHILIIDCARHATYDIGHLVGTMRALGQLGIMVAVEDERERRDIIAAGADMTLELPISQHVFETELKTLATEYALRLRFKSDTSRQKARTPDQGFMGRADSSETEGVWRLIHRGWTLKSPSGKCVPLTQMERVFLTTLFADPHGHLNYADWKYVCAGEENQTMACSSLTAIVFRLKRKCLGAGIELPIRTTRRQGYTFLAPAQIA